MQISLHVNIALRPAVDFLSLSGRPAGHVDECHLLAGNAEALAKRRVLGLVGEEIGFGGKGEFGRGIRPTKRQRPQLNRPCP